MLLPCVNQTSTLRGICRELPGDPRHGQQHSDPGGSLLSSTSLLSGWHWANLAGRGQPQGTTQHLESELGAFKYDDLVRSDVALEEIDNGSNIKVARYPIYHLTADWATEGASVPLLHLSSRPARLPVFLWGPPDQYSSLTQPDSRLLDPPISPSSDSRSTPRDFLRGRVILIFQMTISMGTTCFLVEFVILITKMFLFLSFG